MPDRKRSADPSPAPAAPSTSEPAKPASRFLLMLAGVLLAVWVVVLAVLALAV